jgi:hypothetical protein
VSARSRALLGAILLSYCQKTEAPAPGPELVAPIASSVEVRAGAVDPEHYYLATCEAACAIERIAKRGGKREVLATIDDRPSSIAVSKGTVYATTSRGLVRISNGELTLLLEKVRSHVAADEHALYVIRHNDELLRLEKGSGEVLTIAPDASGSWFAIDAEHAYWRKFGEAGGELSRTPKSGGLPVVLALLSREQFPPETAEAPMAVDATHVYLTSAEGLVRVAKSGGNLERVAPIDGKAWLVRGGVVFDAPRASGTPLAADGDLVLYRGDQGIFRNVRGER